MLALRLLPLCLFAAVVSSRAQAQGPSLEHPDSLDRPPQSSFFLLQQLWTHGRYLIHQTSTPTSSNALYSIDLWNRRAPVLLDINVDTGSLNAPQASIDPTGRRFFYAKGAPEKGLYSAPLDGAVPPVKLDPAGAGDITFYRATPDGERVVFFTEDKEVYIAPSDGSTPAIALDSNPLQGEGTYLPLAVISPDGQWLVLKGQGVHREGTLHGMRTDGTGPTNELTSVPMEHESQAITSDSQTLVFHDLSNSPLPHIPTLGRVRSVRLDGTRSTQILNGPIAAGAPGVRGFHLDLATDEVVYWGAEVPGVVDGFFRVPADGSTAPVLFLQLDAGNIQAACPSPDGQHWVYLSDHETPGVLGLFAVPANGSTPPQTLSLDYGLGIQNQSDAESPFPWFRLTRAGRALFVVETPAAQRGLYTTTLTSGVPVRLSPAVNNQRVYEFDLAVDERFVVFDHGSNAFNAKLYRARIDGSGPLRRLPIGARPETTGEDFTLSSDGTRVLSVNDRDLSGVHEVFQDHLVPPRTLGQRP